MKSKSIIAFCTAAFSLVYALFFTGINYTSPEGAMGWILIPLLFSAATLKGFYYWLHSIRILFIFMMLSAALWKVRSGGLFNLEEMSGILLKQHDVYLVSNNDNWFTQFVYYLVRHNIVAYLFYLTGTLAELLFVIGLFTRKFDKVLIIAFCLFFLFDFFLMRINYFPWIAFMGCFYFSAFTLNKSDSIKTT